MHVTDGKREFPIVLFVVILQDFQIMGSKEKKVSSDICWTQGCCTRRKGKTINERKIPIMGTN